MDGAAELQVAAQADLQVSEPSFQGTDREQVREGLGRVLVAAIAGIDNRDG